MRDGGSIEDCKLPSASASLCEQHRLRMSERESERESERKSSNSAEC